MVRIYYREEGYIKKETDVRMLGGLSNIIWVDLQTPTAEEEEWVEAKCGLSFQTPQEVVEIESSSRYFERNHEITANTYFLTLERNAYRQDPVSFILKEEVLFTYRNTDLVTFADLVKKLKANNAIFSSGIEILLGLFETRIDLDADLVERISREITQASKMLVASSTPNEEILLTIKSLQENTMTLRETIIDKQRTLSNLLKSHLFPDDKRERLRIILKDIASLLEHTTFNFERLEYLQDTFMGLVNLEQNKIIKTFTVVTIFFLPPTLIAGIFGMNFQEIPFAAHKLGFWGATFCMFFPSFLILYYFRKKKLIGGKAI
ncbi:MAG: magnesium/cobalt transporter CorA [Bacteroidia bacterium]